MKYYYAGIGARKTPSDVLKYMELQGKLLAEKGYILRSGGAQGADSAFERGCDSVEGNKQIWSTRNRHEWEEHHWVIPIISRACWEKPFLSMQLHTQRLLGRNTYQLYGDPNSFEDCVKSAFVLYWSEPKDGENCSGGTRYAIRMAITAGIPCFNLYNESEKAEYEATFGKSRKMIHYKIGNIFDTRCLAIVNPINCVGAMGAGLALQFKGFYPEMYKEYKLRCNRGEVKIGSLDLHWINERQVIVNFPTKNHWRYSSKIEYLQQGLETFCNSYKDLQISSIAFPLLGVGKGGLSEDIVIPLMVEYLSRCDIHIEIWKYS